MRGLDQSRSIAPKLGRYGSSSQIFILLGGHLRPICGICGPIYGSIGYDKQIYALRKSVLYSVSRAASASSQACGGLASQSRR